MDDHYRGTSTFLAWFTLATGLVLSLALLFQLADLPGLDLSDVLIGMQGGFIVIGQGAIAIGLIRVANLLVENAWRTGRGGDVAPF